MEIFTGNEQATTLSIDLGFNDLGHLRLAVQFPDALMLSVLDFVSVRLSLLVKASEHV